jgi:predicted enzyme related to lactoylglutathione lyase
VLDDLLSQAVIDESAAGIGELGGVVIDVNNLPIGEAFWSRLLGLDVTRSAWEGQFSFMRKPGYGTVILQLVPETKKELKNRVHIDVNVDDLPRAIEEVVAIGGQIVRPVGAFPPKAPVLEWTVMADPFGNEFCLIEERTEAT